MSTYLYRCDQCGNEHEIRISYKDLQKEYTCRFPVTIDKTGEIVECNGTLRRVYTPFSLRIK